VRLGAEARAVLEAVRWGRKHLLPESCIVSSSDKSSRRAYARRLAAAGCSQVGCRHCRMPLRRALSGWIARP
jgi:hypothetical protein